MSGTIQADSVAALSGRASLKRIEDGLSKTILVGEQAGGAFLFQGGTSSANMNTENTRNSSWIYGESLGGVFADYKAHFNVDKAINTDNSGQLFGFHGGAQAAMCDGSVRLIEEDIHRHVLGALLARNDGSP